MNVKIIDITHECIQESLARYYYSIYDLEWPLKVLDDSGLNLEVFNIPEDTIICA